MLVFLSLLIKNKAKISLINSIFIMIQCLIKNQIKTVILCAKKKIKQQIINT
jgi:hypothetical protein